MLRNLVRCGALAGVFVLGACELEVTNPNQPETARVLATPADVESLLGAQYLRWHIGVYGNSLLGVRGMADVMSFENFSSLANNGMSLVINLPRPALDNAIGNPNASGHRRQYYIPSEAARTASLVLARIDGGLTVGSPEADARAKAFGHFVRGISLGYVALMYDSLAVITPEMSAEDPGELVDYQTAMAAALQALDDAITEANAGAAAFPLPSAWLPSTTTMTSTEFIKLIRSYRARLRASVARTPTERAAVNWDAVIADAQNGITADHDNEMSTVTGPFDQWRRTRNTFSTWHQLTPFVIGMGDVSGGYANWIATPLGDRESFTIITPDLRFPQGADRAAQVADFGLPCSGDTCPRYFRNRPPANDALNGNSWGWSPYDNVRFHSWHQSGTGGTGTGGNGPLVFFTLAELNMLEAEGHIRNGAFAAAAALINKTRVPNGLPAITAMDGTSPVPGGADCVPKKPTGATLACGNMLEAMKWEKRIETHFAHYAGWFLDHRGWGDLPEGTGYHWAPPYEDLQARGRTETIYSTGGLGLGNSGTAGPSTYGW
jgi:hypothetical protein